MTGDGLCPLYMRRWTLLRWGERAVYLHHFVGDDWSLDLHDHPKPFLSIGLNGMYVEETALGLKPWFAPWWRTFPAEHAHRIRLINRMPGEKVPCWTLAIVGRKEREWGWWHKGVWYPWRTYLKMPAAAERKSCP